MAKVTTWRGFCWSVVKNQHALRPLTGGGVADLCRLRRGPDRSGLRCVWSSYLFVPLVVFVCLSFCLCSIGWLFVLYLWFRCHVTLEHLLISLLQLGRAFADMFAFVETSGLH